MEAAVEMMAVRRAHQRDQMLNVAQRPLRDMAHPQDVHQRATLGRLRIGRAQHRRHITQLHRQLLRRLRALRGRWGRCCRRGRCSARTQEQSHLNA